MFYGRKIVAVHLTGFTGKGFYKHFFQPPVGDKAAKYDTNGDLAARISSQLLCPPSVKPIDLKLAINGYYASGNAVRYFQQVSALTRLFFSNGQDITQGCEY